jgi:hypothetical protein
MTAMAARSLSNRSDLRGERLSVTMADDFVKWKALGSKAGVTFHTYPALNHFPAGIGKMCQPNTAPGTCAGRGDQQHCRVDNSTSD